MVIRLIFGSANILLICENVGEMPKNDACQGMTGESIFTVCDFTNHSYIVYFYILFVNHYFLLFHLFPTCSLETDRSKNKGIKKLREKAEALPL